MTTHQSDRQVACDKQSARTVDEQGFLHVEDCNISKACVNPYWGAEIPNYAQLKLDPGKTYFLFRDPQELAKAADTFNNLPLMDKHVEVSAFDLEDPAIKKHMVGSTGTNAKFSAPYLQNTLVVWTAGAIEGIMSKEQTELSCAYRYELDMTPGEYEGTKYDMRMTDIRGNHVALVDEGRAGPDVTVKDRKQQPRVDMKKIGQMVADALRDYTMSKKEAVTEHKRLVKNLLSGDPKKKITEAAVQAHELNTEIDPSSVTEDEDDVISDIIEHQEGHKSSKGKLAPWIIKSETTGKVLWSGPSKAEAVKALANMKGHAEDLSKSVTADIEKREDVSAKSGVTEYGKVKFADPKNKKYPIDTPEHVRAALSYWGRARNQNKYSEEDKATIQRRLEAAARTHNIGEHAEGK